MKLLNQSLLYLSIPMFILVNIWAVIFYFSMLDEIYNSIDNGLDNYKMLIIQKAKKDNSILQKVTFGESNYAVQEVEKMEALTTKDSYSDTLMYRINEEELESIRMLTTAFLQQGKYYELKVISSMVEEDDQIANLFWAVFWLYILLLLSIILINNVVLQKLWQPFYNLLEHLKSFQIDQDRSLPQMETQTREFLELKTATDTLINHTLTAYQNQKQFIENAAHELQTPLAIITNKLELLLENNTLTIADSEIVAQVMQTTSRLIKLNQSLLLLSKIENKQFFDNKPVSINQLVQQITTDMEDFIAFKNIELTILEPAKIIVNMDAQLAYILVANLIKNAVFHNLENGQLSLTLQPQMLTVTNTSAAKALDAEQIFKRFHKTTTKRKSTGLGLAIVQAIARLYGLAIAYDYVDNGHSFSVKFN